MFKSITIQERLRKAEAENSALRAQLAQTTEQLARTTAQTAYIAMMGDVELPVTTDAVQQPSLEEGSDDDDEQMV